MHDSLMGTGNSFLEPLQETSEVCLDVNMHRLGSAQLFCIQTTKHTTNADSERQKEIEQLGISATRRSKQATTVETVTRFCETICKLVQKEPELID